MTAYDIIIVGAGHNGLVTAAYLARAGRRVLVFERRELVGGACVTEEVWPGFKVSTAAYVNSLLRPEIIRDLALKRHGFEMLPRNPSSFTPFPDGRYLMPGPAAAARRHGAEVRCNAAVARIVTRAGRAAGVALEDGTEIAARQVVSNADAHVTFLKLMDVKELPPDFLEAVRAIDYTSASLK